MAIAYSVIKRLPLSNKTIVDITLDGSYATGGYALSNSGLGMLAKPSMVDPVVATGQGFTPDWDQVNHKLKMFKSAGASGAHSECASGDLSTSVVVRCEVTGDVVM